MQALRILVLRVVVVSCCLLVPLSGASACVAVPWPPEKLCNTARVIVRAATVKYLKEPEEVALSNLAYTRGGVIEFKVVEVLKGES